MAGPSAGPSTPSTEAKAYQQLSKKAKHHVGRLYQVHAWMLPNEKIRMKTLKALFDKVNALRPGYFNHQVELMDDTTTKYYPCREFQTGRCTFHIPIHSQQITKPNGKRLTIQVIHGCDLCFYGRWDLGHHTINACHLKHLLPQGTGERPWDRRERKLREEKEKAKLRQQQQSKQTPTTPPKPKPKPKPKPHTISPSPPPSPIDIASSPSSSSSSSSSDEEDKKKSGELRKRKNPSKKSKKKKKSYWRMVTETLTELNKSVQNQNKILLEQSLRSTFVGGTDPGSDLINKDGTSYVDTSPPSSVLQGLSTEADPSLAENSILLGDLDEDRRDEGEKPLAELNKEMEQCENLMKNMDEIQPME